VKFPVWMASFKVLSVLRSSSTIFSASGITTCVCGAGAAACALGLAGAAGLVALGTTFSCPSAPGQTDRRRLAPAMVTIGNRMRHYRVVCRWHSFRSAAFRPATKSGMRAPFRDAFRARALIISPQDMRGGP
jgi:hypothetical protein